MRYKKFNKKARALAIAVCSVLLITSCDQNDFLTEVNPNTITNETFWKSKQDFQTGLNTVYAAMQYQSISGGGLVFEEVMSDIAGSESWYDPIAFRNFTFTDADQNVTNKWANLYTGIFRANQVISKLQTAEPSIFAAGEKESIEAQARTLRAFYYFLVANTYGGAVIHTKVAQTKEDLQVPFSSIAEVNNQIIIPDLQFAKANLPQKWSGENVGRVTTGTATALLGKVYLFDKQWAAAAAEFKNVIDSGVYSLTANIMDNFDTEHEFNSESILEVAYSATKNPGANGDNVDDTPYTAGAEASNLARAYGQLNYGGYNTLLPSYFIHELYLNDEVDPTNSINTTNIHSKRLTASIAPANFEGQYYLLDNGVAKGWGYGQSAYIKKYSNWYNVKSEDGNSRSGINCRQIRLADVYLMYAEAVLNASGDLSSAIFYIDEVRARAGVKTIQEYLDANGNKFPQLHISKEVHGTQPLVEPTKKTLLTHIQRVERPLELAFEGHRFKDLVRWGIVQQVFNELVADENWRLANIDVGPTAVPVQPLLLKERIRDDFRNASTSYNSAKNDYWPIPAVERQSNNQLN
ncbi:RagB/SusD family nutrient uptake outer membrane protein [Flavobacterium saccharophilum]|uniref:Starch-binding associating with outer membrane n=1 Tax=Flavobacterium saccharophilum TaxID=29534 RepID=A0A1M7JKD2_9FLAO|nr:RagB/SusD family nutrient uptake outer membrane protein [Flavobacterium saccharophilum]SHM53569.1 Starch-binding associating with outer membrane [Flavobacterium saccharophilum]